MGYGTPYIHLTVLGWSVVNPRGGRTGGSDGSATGRRDTLTVQLRYTKSTEMSLGVDDFDLPLIRRP